MSLKGFSISFSALTLFLLCPRSALTQHSIRLCHYCAYPHHCVGVREILDFQGHPYKIGAAGGFGRVLFNLAKNPTTALGLVTAGAVPVIVEQLRKGPVLRPKNNRNQRFVEWLSATLHALCMHERTAPTVAAAFSLPQDNANVKHAIETTLQNTVKEHCDRVLLSWRVPNPWATKHLKELGLPAKRGSAECFKLQNSSIEMLFK